MSPVAVSDGLHKAPSQVVLIVSLLLGLISGEIRVRDAGRFVEGAL